MNNKKNKITEIVIPQENISFVEVDLPYSDFNKHTYKAFVEVNLFHINRVVLQWDGEKYIDLSGIDCIEKCPSPYTKELLNKSLAFADLKKLREPYKEFVKRNRIDNFKEFLSQDGMWSQWHQEGEYVYDLMPDKEISPAIPAFYKYFLPFRLRHAEPHNLPDVLYHHRDKYYKENPHVFYSLVEKIIKEKTEDFWINDNTVVAISDWLLQNSQTSNAEIIYWFNLIYNYKEGDKKRHIGLLLSDLKEASPPFVDQQEEFINFNRLFFKRSPYQVLKKINWTGTYGELHWFIKILETRVKCSSNSKWVACSNLFVVDKKDFHPNQVSGNKHILPDRKKKLERIIKSV